MYKQLLSVIILLIIVLLYGCDKGIEPAAEQEIPSGQTGFSGKVTFSGTWPIGIKRTHIVVFKNPILSSEDFFPPNLSFVIDSIPYRSTAYNYNSIEKNFIPIFQLAPGEYSYVVVAQSKTPEISLDRKDWLVVGVYCSNNDQTQPLKLVIQQGQMTSGVNINVDFSNSPPQPPQ